MNDATGHVQDSVTFGCCYLPPRPWLVQLVVSFSSRSSETVADDGYISAQVIDFFSF